jgi:PAS domain S-box-containing protein
MVEMELSTDRDERECRSNKIEAPPGHAEHGAEESGPLRVSVVEHSDDAVMTIDPSGNITSWDRGAEHIYGYAAEEAVGKALSILVPECCRNEVPEILGRISRGENAHHYETLRQRKDGRTINVSLCISPIMGQGGEIIGASIITRDVSKEVMARRKAETAVEAERRRFIEVLDRLPAYVALLTADHHVAFANRYFREHFGYDAEKRCYEHLFDRDRPCEDCHSYDAMKTGKPQHWEWTGPDGNAYDVSDYPFIDVDGSEMVLEIGINVTTRKRAEEALRKAFAYNRSLIEASLDPLVTIGPDGKITDVNEATELVTGRKREELIGTDFSDYFTEPEAARAGYEKVFREGLVRDYALEIRHKDGRMTPVLYNAQVYRDDEGKVIGVFAAARDVTAQKRVEAELAVQRKVELERLAELEKFQRLTVGRELKMVELKKEIMELKALNADLRRRLE